MKSPCFRCTNRQLGCHSKCEQYKNFKEIFRKMTKEREIDRYISSAIARMKGVR